MFLKPLKHLGEWCRRISPSWKVKSFCFRIPFAHTTAFTSMGFQNVHTYCVWLWSLLPDLVMQTTTHMFIFLSRLQAWTKSWIDILAPSKWDSKTQGCGQSHINTYFTYNTTQYIPMIHVHISYILYIFLKDITDITSKSHPLWRAYQKFPLLLKHPDDSTCIKADGHPLSWSSIGRHLSRKGLFGGSCGKVKQIFKNLVENDMCKLSLNMIFENDIWIIWIWFYIQMSKLPKYHPRFIEHFFPLTLLFKQTV